MDAYTSFAQVYDLFMDNVPYDEWCAYICETLKKHGIADGPVLDRSVLVIHLSLSYGSPIP